MTIVNHVRNIISYPFGARCLLGVLSCVSGGLGCSDEATVIDASAAPGSEPEAPADGAEPSNPAIMLATYVRGPSDDNVYVRALPEVPSGEIEYSGYLELGPVNVFTHAGYVFVWDSEAALMTRYAVNEALDLVEGPALSLLNEGYSGIDGHSHAFVSETRAYSMSPQLDQVIIWNPQTMQITGTIAMQAPERPAAMATGVHYGLVHGEHVVWRLVSADWDSNALYPATTLAIARTDSDEPVQIVEDDRCAAGYDGAFVDSEGDLYVQAGAHWGSFAAYGPGAGSLTTCVLRVRAGETSFDPGYLLDYQAVTGSYLNRVWFPVSGSKFFGAAWDPERPVPEELDLWYQDNTFRPLLVDVVTMQAQPYPSLEGTVLISSLPFRLDGTTYYQLSGTGFGLGSVVDVVELREEGVQTRFRAPGELWAIGRVR